MLFSRFGVESLLYQLCDDKSTLTQELKSKERSLQRTYLQQVSVSDLAKTFTLHGSGWLEQRLLCLSNVLFSILRNIKPLDTTLVGKGISQTSPKIFGILHNVSLVIVFMSSLRCLNTFARLILCNRSL